MALVLPLPLPDTDTQDPRVWLRSLSKRLWARQSETRSFEAYYEGRHNLAYASAKFRQSFGNLFAALSDNWCEVVVDAVEERLNVVGFRFGETPEADKEAWEIWQRNCLDADSALTHTDLLVGGAGYALVWGTDDGTPVITVESPGQAIVAHRTGARRERAAGLKQWIDDDGYLYSIVYLPDGVYKYRSSNKLQSVDGATLSMEGDLGNAAFWEEWHPQDDGKWPLDNPFGKVPLVPLYNRPRTGRVGKGQSELHVVKPLQDAVNKLLADLILASEYGAFRQRWATGLTLERDEEGNVKLPFEHGPGKVWTMEADGGPGSETQRFGEFSETDLTHIISAIEMIVMHVASQSRTPPHYLNASADRLSGESIKAAETGLVAKCYRKMRPIGESWEEVMRLAFAVIEDPRRDEYAAETIWKDPESRTEAEHVDAVLKKQTIGVPDEQLWEDLGYTPQQIARFKAMRAQDDLRKAMLAPPAPPALAPGQPAPPQPGGPPQPAPAPPAQ